MTTRSDARTEVLHALLGEHLRAASVRGLARTLRRQCEEFSRLFREGRAPGPKV